MVPCLIFLGDRTTMPISISRFAIISRKPVTICVGVTWIPTRDVKYPTHTQGEIGAINNVYGESNAAKVSNYV